MRPDRTQGTPAPMPDINGSAPSPRILATLYGPQGPARLARAQHECRKIRRMGLTYKGALNLLEEKSSQ